MSILNDVNAIYPNPTPHYYYYFIWICEQVHRSPEAPNRNIKTLNPKPLTPET